MRTIPREVLTFQRLKSQFVYSPLQYATAIGTLLGDGTLAKRGKEYRLHVKHGFSQLRYVQHKHHVFENITSMPVRVFSQYVREKSYKFAEFVTLTHPFFSQLHELFYQNGRKGISEQLCSEISHPLTIATWFMDDGNREYAGASFNTQCFSIAE